MSQFILIDLENEIRAAGIRFERIGPHQDHLWPVAQRYLPNAERLYSAAADDDEGAEPLVYEVAEASSAGKDVLQASALGRLLAQALSRGAAFLCWYGDDFENLPLVRDESDLRHELAQATLDGPYELYFYRV